MTWKEIEARRIPEIAWIMMTISPEARQTVKNKCMQVKNTIRRKREKRG